MAGEDGRGCWSRQTVAVMFVLCCLAQSFTCFSLRGLSRNIEQDEVVSEATETELKTGSIYFNGKELDFQSGSISAAATGNDVDLDDSDSTGMMEQASQLEHVSTNEKAWRRLKPTLHCGQSKMKLKAMGPGAAYLQLDIGNAHPLPLTQLPETCGYTMNQNPLGLILVVSYDGCNVLQEDGNYVLAMRWLTTPVKLSCPMSLRSASTPEPARQPMKLSLPHGSWSLNRHKRQTSQPLPISDPRHPLHRYWYYYYMYYMTPATPAPTTATTTAMPNTTTTTAEPDTTTKPSTEKPPQMPVYPYYMYYPYYYYYPYYPFPNVPVRTTTPPPTTTAQSTGGMTTTDSAISTTAATTTAPGTTTTSKMTTTPPMTTTMASTPTTNMLPQTSQNPYIPPYPYPYPYPYYPPGLPYYQVVQHYYGKPNPNVPMLPTLPPVLTTAKPANPTSMPKPTDTSPTTKPTTKPTAASTIKTTTRCPPTTKPTTKPSSDKYPGQMKPFAAYNERPFIPVVSYKAGKLPDYGKFMPQAAYYKSGPQARAHPPPHPGFNYWQPVPWFPQSTGHDNLQFDWKNLMPKYV